MIGGMILAAGLGSRLGKLTENTPKCLVTVAGKPLLQHVIERYKLAQVNKVVVNTFYLADQVEAFLTSIDFGVEIIISREPALLGTGGGVLFAKKYLENFESFFVHNADVISTIELSALKHAHEQHKNLATLSVMERSTTRALVFNSDDLLIGWENQGVASAGTIVGSKRAFSGIQVLSSEIFPYLEALPTPSSTITAFLNAASVGKRIEGVTTSSDEEWFDVGTPERLQRVKEWFGDV